MADVSYQYNHTAVLQQNKTIDFTNLRVMLLKSTATFVATNTSVNQVAGTVSGGHRSKELYGNGWTEGGELIANVSAVQFDFNGDGITNDSKLVGDDIAKDATGGNLPPGEKAYAHLVFDATSQKPLVYVDYGGANGARQAGETVQFKVRFTAGILTLAAPAQPAYPQV